MRELSKKIVLRGGVYTIGLFILATGTVLSVRSELGVSPVNALPYIVSQITAWELGFAAALVFCGFIGVQALMLRREFRWKHGLQIACAVMFGGFVSLAEICTQILPAPETYLQQWLCMLLSVVMVSVGILLYVSANVISLPVEGVLQTLQMKRGTPLAKAKFQFDFICVCAAVVLALLFLGDVPGIREGTVFSVFGVGLTIRFVKWLKEKIGESFSEA